jgi:hypothetical protein
MFGGGVLAPAQTGLAVVDDDPEITLTRAAEPDREVPVRLRIMFASGREQDAPKFLDGMVDEIELPQEAGADVVLASDVPAVEGVLVAQVRDELRHRHLSLRPSDDRVRFPFENVVHDRSHALFLVLEPPQKGRMVHRLQRRLPFLEATCLRNIVTLQIGFKMADNFNRDPGYVSRYLMSSPTAARAHRGRLGRVHRRQKLLGFTASLNHTTHRFRSPALLPTHETAARHFASFVYRLELPRTGGHHPHRVIMNLGPVRPLGQTSMADPEDLVKDGGGGPVGEFVGGPVEVAGELHE